MSRLLHSAALRVGAVLALLWAFLALYPDTREAFTGPANLSNVTAQVAEIIIIGVGMTFVILVRGIDLSVGAGIALGGVIAAKLQIDNGASAIVAVAVCSLVLTLVGVWHGFLVARVGVPSFVATLSGFLAYRGAALVISDARGLSPMHADFLHLAESLSVPTTRVLLVCSCAIPVALKMWEQARRKSLGLEPIARVQLIGFAIAAALLCALGFTIYRDGVPMPVVIAGIFVVGGIVILERTRYGRYAVAIGSNPEAARLLGLPVRRVLIFVYGFCGFCTAFGAMVACARTNGTTPGSAGLMRELHVITAVVMGGTSLQGGQASVGGTVLGALLFGTLANGMNLLNINSNWQLIVSGAILLGASAADAIAARKRK